MTSDRARGYLAALAVPETAVGEVHHERFLAFRTPPIAANGPAPPAFEALDRPAPGRMGRWRSS